MSDFKTAIIAQTDDCLACKMEDPDGETIYDLELNYNVTVHFFMEEWEEFVAFSKDFVDVPAGTTGTLADSDNYCAVCEQNEAGEIEYILEIPGASLYFFEDQWQEVCKLMKIVLNK